MRMQKWRETGCNAFDGKRPMGKPMSFWTEQDVLAFLKGENIPYCSVYGDIVASDGENDYPSTLIEKPLHCTGCQRTGCMFCGFGAHLEKGENRFERMKHTHPKHYEFCIGGGELSSTTNAAFSPATCLTRSEILAYIGDKGRCYGWHMSNLRIYDTPRELSEFRRATDPCDSCHAEYTWECTDCKKLSGDIKRPPQSWCYVEAIDNG